MTRGSRATASRIALLHWNADEADARAGRLRRSGHRVITISSDGGPALRELRASPPDAVVIDLNRIPSQGRDAAAWLRQKAREASARLRQLGRPASAGLTPPVESRAAVCS